MSDQLEQYEDDEEIPITVCPECFYGFHSECIGQGCYCDCQLEVSHE